MLYSSINSFNSGTSFALLKLNYNTLFKPSEGNKMGQNQLLIISLLIVITGIAIMVGIHKYNAMAATSNLDAVINDLLYLASDAQGYYLRSSSSGGGGNSFRNLTVDNLSIKSQNDNGKYEIILAESLKAVIQGVGNLDSDGDGINCTVQISVFNDSVAVALISR